MRIVYCINSLSSLGGRETVTISKASALAQNPSNSIWIITCCDDSVKTCIPVSPHIHLLGIKNRITWLFPWNILQLTIFNRGLKHEIKHALNQIDPDIVISTGGVDKWIVPFIKGRWATIREIHSEKQYRKREDNSVITRITASIANFFDYSLILKRFQKIVVLTFEDKEQNWNHNDNVCVIPNPLRFEQLYKSDLKNKRIISVGRLVYSKDFSTLLQVFAKVKERCPDWSLDIYGEGHYHDRLLSEIVSRGLSSSVRLMGNSLSIQDELIDHSIFVCTSRYEGFSMVLIEAMGCGLPVVSFACPCGPKDIISDGVNGFLIQPGDEDTMVDRICQIAESECLRINMGTAAYERARDYNIEHICKMWEDLFQQLRKES